MSFIKDKARILYAVNVFCDILGLEETPDWAEDIVIKVNELQTGKNDNALVSVGSASRKLFLDHDTKKPPAPPANESEVNCCT